MRTDSVAQLPRPVAPGLEGNPPLAVPVAEQAAVHSPAVVAAATDWLTRLAQRPITALAVIFAFSLPLFFLNMGAWGFFDPDEGRYAEIPREMLQRHDFITPTLNGLLYFEKPPLLYWLVAASFKSFGLHEWAARLVPAAAACSGLIIAYFLGRRMFSARVGLLGALILGTSLLWPVLGRNLIIDTVLSVAMFAAAAFWWLGSNTTGPRRRLLLVGFWVALALAVLSKGPVAVVLVGAAIFGYTLISGEWGALKRMEWPLGLLVFAAISVPWFVLVARHNPEFNHYFWYEQHVNRFLGRGEQREHVQGPDYFFKLLPLLLFPWSVFLPGAIWAARRRLWPMRSKEQRAAVFLLCYIVVIVGFFSASTCKLIPYILPAFPALALLLAAYLDGLVRGAGASRNGQLWIPLKVLVVLVCALIAAALWLLPRQLSELAQSGPLPAYTLGAACVLWLAALLVCQRARNANGTLWTVAGGLTLMLYAALWPLAQIAPAMQCRQLIAAIQPGLDRGATLVCMDYLQSLNFYARRLLPVDGYIGELKFGYDHAPADVRHALRPKGMPALRALMAGPQPVYYVAETGPAAGALAREFGGGAAVIVSNQRRAIVGNAAAARLTPPQTNSMNG